MRRGGAGLGRHAEDLSVLAIGPRGPADEIAVSWDDVDAAVQGTEGRAWPYGAGATVPMRLASPSIRHGGPGAGPAGSR